MPRALWFGLGLSLGAALGLAVEQGAGLRVGTPGSLGSWNVAREPIAAPPSNGASLPRSSLPRFRWSGGTLDRRVGRDRRLAT